MSITYIRVTVADILDAMERNGFRQARNGEWINYNKDGSVRSACAMGQAVINLGIDLSSFQRALVWNDDLQDLKISIIDLNDSELKSCEVIATEMRKRFSHLLDKQLMLSTSEYKVRSKDG